MFKKISLIITSILIIIIGIYISLILTYPTTSPANSLHYYILRILHPHSELKKEVIGFLPYWRLDDIQYIKPELVSEINYFALYADGKGNILKGTNTQPEPSWKYWQSDLIKNLVAKTQILGAKFSLSLAIHKNNDIENLLDSTSAQQNLINNILSETNSYHLDAINLDFEYQGQSDQKHQQQFTKFTKLLSIALHDKSPKTKIYLSLAPLSARGKTLFDLKNINPYIDKYIGMSYDYYGQASSIAGPTAPMKGFTENKFFFDITTTYKDYHKYIPKEKIIMGVPYYGWDWAVQNGKKIQSKTYPPDDPKNYAAVISYSRMRSEKNINSNNCLWDEYALQTWCWYKDEKNTEHQVWLEDNKSINIKFDYMKNQNFSGIAIWTIGFDKNYPDLWSMIQNKFTAK